MASTTNNIDTDEYSEDQENVEPGQGPSNSKKAKTWRMQNFSDSWLKLPEFSGWLSKSNRDGMKQAVCTVCNDSFKHPNKHALLKHASSDKHTKAMKASKIRVKIGNYFKPKDSQNPDPEKLTAKAELLMVGFMAEHRTPFAQADHIIDLLKAMFPDSKIAANMKLKRTKASYIMQDGLAFEEKYSVASICQTQHFSLLIDESTDVSVSQILAVVVRFLQDNAVHDALLDVVEVEEGTAEGLYRSVINLLNTKDIPLDKVIGFAADNRATMMGANSTIVKADLPDVFVLGCVCHSFALCASHASHRLPSWLETFLKDTCAYFARSSKRMKEFEMIQAAVKITNHRILKLAQTRWLSRGMVVARILEQWEALKLFFQAESPKDKVDGAANILKVMTAPGTKHMLHFLKRGLR